MPLARRRVTDTSGLKALAHPVRIALLDVLVTDGPLTASQASTRVGESASNCSWHLRKLAEHGFVREVRGRTGRQRPWQAVREGLEWDSASTHAADPADGLASEAVMDTLVEREVQRLRAARASRDGEPPEWREATCLVQSRLWLTAEEAHELKDTVARLLSRHRERVVAPATRPPDARLMALVAWLVPTGPPVVSPAALSGDPTPPAGARL